jgi:quinoprotein glucose dehydrogenase
LFGESLVAVDIKTGKRKWHFQFVHHGIWDMDIPCAPILADVVINGRTVKIVAQPTKQSYLYVFNRETGEPIWPIEERAVAKGDVPGEWYSPTQPFPTKPPAYDRQGVTADDLIDFTPELRAEALKVISRYKIGPLFTPPVVSKREGPLGVLMAPAAGGGTNWPGGSYDPETHILYVSSNSSVGALGLVPPDPGQSDIAYIQGNAMAGPRRTGGSGSQAGGGQRVVSGPGAARAEPAEEGGGGGGGGLNVQGLPIQKPPYGVIAAIDLNKGDLLWKIAHGETPDNIRNHPALKGLNIPRTGRPGSVGTLVTKTLLIAGETGVGMTATGSRGSMLRAYNKASGAEVGAVYMPAAQSGSPMTYLAEGKQYLVVAISGGNYSGELLAFRLP